MEEEKKSEPGWEDSKKLGPYQLHEQVPQDEFDHGTLYRATNETSGATALVLELPTGDEEDAVPVRDWRVRCMSSASPSYLALEVEHSPWSVAPDKHSVEALVFLFEELREGVRRMALGFSDSDEPRPRRRLGGVLAAVAVLALALLPTTLAAVTEQQVLDDTREAWATDVNVDPVPVRPGDAPKPVRNQKRAPCTAGLEVEVSGVCWLSVTQRPCPQQTVAWQGQCLLPVAVPRPPGTSVDADGGSESR
ncbi:hypothetical protein JQX13_32095 [Archangium violaceum]|uniref:hypothetical protein n=1 Tax=Archangium violaceum TaxID=83451 RepID=UPI00193BB924|nr:hypothetical protein [Archangium violaceum]QRK04845.1 hypothetical protein JQX13_32095 [Archangium violaceum]